VTAAAASAPDLDEKPASGRLCFCLENFTAESEEAASDDNVLKGTVLNSQATHVVVDNRHQVRRHAAFVGGFGPRGNPKFKPGDEIE